MSEALTPERWQRVKEIFQSALDLPLPKRRAYVRDNCAGDDALASEVESLLQCEQDADDFLSEPAAAYVPRAMEEPFADAQIGRQIDAYRIVRQIGEGGMGVVYLARQVSLDRNVAVKVLAPELAKDASFIARFTREAFAAKRIAVSELLRGRGA